MRWMVFSLVLDGTNGLFFTRRFSFQKNGLEDVVLFFASPGSFYHISVRHSKGEHSNAPIVIHTDTDCFVCQEVQPWFSENFIARFIEWNESFLCNAVNRSAMRLTAINLSVPDSTAVNKGKGEYFISKCTEIRVGEEGYTSCVCCMS